MDRRKLIAGSLLAAAASLAVRAVAKSEPAPAPDTTFILMSPDECRAMEKEQRKLVSLIMPGLASTFSAKNGMWSWLAVANAGHIAIEVGIYGWPRQHKLLIKCNDLQNFDMRAYGEALLKLKHAVLSERGLQYTLTEDNECILL